MSNASPSSGMTPGVRAAVMFSNHYSRKRNPPLCHIDRSAAQWRDLRFRGSLAENKNKQQDLSGWPKGQLTFSVEKHFQQWTDKPQISPLRFAPVEMTKGSLSFRQE